MKILPSLDAHAHLDPTRTAVELADSGAVLAMTISLDEAALVVGRREPIIVWGVGCHPRNRRSQESFDAKRFRQLAEQTAVVGEIGLDTGSRVPLEVQLRTFRQALEVVSDLPRLVSIHSYRATGLVIEELQRRPVVVPVLHWWTGSAEESGRPWPLGAISQSIRLSLGTRSFVRLSRLSECSSKATMAITIHPLLSRVGSSGWSTWSPNS
jgi:TatD DNase family protein